MRHQLPAEYKRDIRRALSAISHYASDDYGSLGIALAAYEQRLRELAPVHLKEIVKKEVSRRIHALLGQPDRIH